MSESPGVYLAEGSKPRVVWHPFASNENWMASQPIQEWRKHFETEGFLVVKDLIDAQNVDLYRDIYAKMMANEIDCRNHRHDLGSNEARKQKTSENVTQIMWPSDYVEGLDLGPLHLRSKLVSQLLLGDDMAFDFDMLIAKAPHTMTDVPWHQDEGYWLNMQDKRAASCWTALDHAIPENGCMWFIPGSHLKPLLKHTPAANKCHVLVATEALTQPDSRPPLAVPLTPGSCTFHGGRMLHHTRGNSTDTMRRAFITNHRPASMVEWERSQGFSHARAGLHTLHVDAHGQGDTVIASAVESTAPPEPSSASVART